MTLNDSTRRALRTGLDVLLAILIVLGAAVPLLGVSDPTAVAALLGAVLMAVNKIKNGLEDAGILRPFLKYENVKPEGVPAVEFEDGDDIESTDVVDDGAPA